MRKIHNIDKVYFVDDCLLMTIDGQEHRFVVTAISSKLAAASMTERMYYRVMASGYGIHWPLVDEDLSIDGLLGIEHQPTKSRKRMSRALQEAVTT